MTDGQSNDDKTTTTTTTTLHTIRKLRTLTMTNTNKSIENNNLRILQKTQALMEMERTLSMSMERAEPWLTMGSSGDGRGSGDDAGGAVPPLSSSSSCYSFGTFQSRVRPIPRTMEEVKLVLDVGRNYSTRTSAPAGWNHMAPLMGFASPNPLPSQLRSGALAALELQTAKDKLLEISNRRLKKEQQQQRLKEEEEQEMEKKRRRGRDGDGDDGDKKKIRGGTQPMDIHHDTGSKEDDGRPLPPPNSGEAKRRPQHLKDDEQDDEQNQRQKPLNRRISGAAAAGLAVTSAPPVDMNLSDSSSDDDDDDSDDSD